METRRSINDIEVPLVRWLPIDQAALQLKTIQGHNLVEDMCGRQSHWSSAFLGTVGTTRLTIIVLRELERLWRTLGKLHRPKQVTLAGMSQCLMELRNGIADGIRR